MAKVSPHNLSKASGILPENLADYASEQINLRVKGNYMTKGTLMLIDLIASNNWERPIYFNNTSLASIGLDLDLHIASEGMAYRLLPIIKPANNPSELINTELAYRNIKEKFAFRGMDNPNNYFDDEYRRFTSNHRSSINSVVIGLIDEDKMEEAADLLELSINKMPHEAIPYDLASGQSVPLYFEVGKDSIALDIVNKMTKRSIEMLKFYIDNNREFDREAMISSEMTKYFIPLLMDKGYEKEAIKIKADYEKVMGR
jgi:hypothetical protein